MTFAFSAFAYLTVFGRTLEVDMPIDCEIGMAKLFIHFLPLWKYGRIFVVP